MTSPGYSVHQTDKIPSGRYDWLWMDNRGKTTTRINQRGDDKSLIPHWLEAVEAYPGVDRQGGKIEDDNEDRHRIQFGRIFADERTDVSLALIRMLYERDLWGRRMLTCGSMSTTLSTRGTRMWAGLVRRSGVFGRIRGRAGDTKLVSF